MLILNPNELYFIHILSPDHCREVQSRLFQLGATWSNGVASCIHEDIAQRLFLRGGGGQFYISYVDNDRYVPEEVFFELKLEDLYDGAEEAPSQGPETVLDTKPTRYAKWNLQCLAKHILEKYPPMGTMAGAMTLLLKDGKGYYSHAELLAFSLKYPHERPKDLPEEIITELRRRKDA